ncbi:MAG: sulfurtransferase-like selenium metabolism protein YedF [Desulfobacterota bacterium]|nr:sulfurtransferase-like selenium metabolism protein YedF [Thermodesulfobacteriota bacterium]
MAFQVDARGLGCPEPLILTKNAIEKHDEVEVLLDSPSALENIKRMALDKKLEIKVSEENGTYRVLIVKPKTEDAKPETVPENQDKNTVLVITSQAMGRGDEELGKVLMRAFLHTVSEIEKKPEKIVLYNEGVILAKKDSSCLEELKTLERQGVEIILCGTCVNYFKIKEDIRVGRISNMYEIVEALFSAKRILYP